MVNWFVAKSPLTLYWTEYKERERPEGGGANRLELRIKERVHMEARVHFTEGGKPENPWEKNPRSTGETNYNNSTHMSSKFFWESTRGHSQTAIHPNTNTFRPGLSSADKTPPPSALIRTCLGRDVSFMVI